MSALSRKILSAAVILLGAELALFTANAASAAPQGRTGTLRTLASLAGHRHLSQFIIQGPIGFGTYSRHRRPFHWDGESQGGSRSGKTRRKYRYHALPKASAEAPGPVASRQTIGETREQKIKASQGDELPNGAAAPNTQALMQPGPGTGVPSADANRSVSLNSGVGTARASGNQAGQSPDNRQQPPQNPDKEARLAQPAPGGQQSFANVQPGGKGCEDCEDSCYTEWHVNCASADLCGSGYASCLRMCKRQSCK